ncbi:terbinafine resistance locus protein [Nannochloropsis gaditana]|uniref:Terbinafine resistance locus protein n=1 Tax=Nannochloropsis gaditana TaxID=72520 RepID=W7TC21_9STRA|nr:terbinafine resistance locus protein [Nannochloropsis gaditana]
MMSAAQQQAHGQQNSQYVGQMDGQNSMTLDEPVWQTVKRDLTQVGSKLQVVLLPRENQDGVLKKLKDWDLWGPLLVCLTLSILLSITAPEEQGALVFAAVFFVVWFGAAVVTMNAQLLGGTMCVLEGGKEGGREGRRERGGTCHVCLGLFPGPRSARFYDS